MTKQCDTTFEVDETKEKKRNKKLTKDYYGDIPSSSGWDWEATYEEAH